MSYKMRCGIAMTWTHTDVNVQRHLLCLGCCIQVQRRRGEKSVDKTFQLRRCSWRCDVEDVCDCCAKQTPCISCSSGCAAIGHVPDARGSHSMMSYQEQNRRTENCIFASDFARRQKDPRLASYERRLSGVAFLTAHAP